MSSKTKIMTGTSTEYLKKRIQQIDPTVLEQIGSQSRFKSVREAAIAVGACKPTSVVALSRNIASVADRIKQAYSPAQVRMLIDFLSVDGDF